MGAPIDGADKFVLYTHGADGAANQFTDNAGPWPLSFREWLIDNGFGWVEGTGGGLQSWGNRASETAYNELIDYVDKRYTVDQWLVLGRSMGGVVATRIYQARRNAEARNGTPYRNPSRENTRWIGLIINSGTQNLLGQYDYQNGARRPQMNAAWGVDNRDAFVAAIAGLNPIDGPPSAWQASRVLQMWGTADDVVVPATNGEAMRAMYAGVPELDLVDIRVGGDHSSANGSYARVGVMTSFIANVSARKYMYRTQLFQDGELRETTPNRDPRLRLLAPFPGQIVT
ncbi:hypothetical protein [Microbacterium sp. NPDC089188]|uniref:alpha/beta fold hydrolase n=1 Tax=Microbacterium sp. NPDC089188 TaxID=3154971 RepID=UPI003432D4C5